MLRQSFAREDGKMKRIHIHISVDDLERSVKFYSALVGQQPSVTKRDYAKWEVSDPNVNLAISRKSDKNPGLDHIGIQAGTSEELTELYDRLGDANIAMMDQKGAKCCYAESDKHWAVDPSGVAWEMFHTMREVAVYGDDRARDVHSVVATVDASA